MKPVPPKMGRLTQWALRLNRRQTRAFVLGLGGFLIAAMNPPWDFYLENELGGVRKISAGFHFAGSPPYYGGEMFHVEAHVNWLLFLLILAVCAAVAVAVVVGLRDKNSEANSTYGEYR